MYVAVCKILIFQGFAINWDEVCNDSQPYVPFSKYDLLRILQVVDTSQIKPPFKFFNDYKRLNLTHFWSDIANTWWSYSNEAQQMSSDKYSIGYRKYYLTFRKWLLKCHNTSSIHMIWTIYYESYYMIKNILRILTKSSCCM